MTGNVQLACTLGRQVSGILACGEHLGEDVQKRPTVVLGGNELVELLHHRGVVVLRLGIHGNHTAGITHTEHLLAGELPVNVTGQSGLELDVLHMLLIVENALIEVADAPTQRDVVVE